MAVAILVQHKMGPHCGAWISLILGSSVLLILLGWLLHWGWLWWPGLAALIFFGYFFRDPERLIPPEPEVVVSPADGKVILTDEVQEERYLNGPAR